MYFFHSGVCIFVDFILGAAGLRRSFGKGKMVGAVGFEPTTSCV
jgi:hypothetical protein